MIDGYFLRGTNGEYLLVVRATEPECLRPLVKRMASMRDKEIRKLGEHLEAELNDGIN